MEEQMKKPWINPVNRPAKQSTLDTPGDFQKFMDLMRKVVQHPPLPTKKQQQSSSSSRDPDAS